jgi:hypothetical protein
VWDIKSLLSAQWFPDSERNRATAVAILANNFGAAVGLDNTRDFCHSPPPYSRSYEEYL